MAGGLCIGFCLIITLTMIECNKVSQFRRLEHRTQARFDTLQDRLDRESRFRREDMRHFFEKIESISAVFNVSTYEPQCPTQTETRLSDTSTNWRQDLMQLTKAFKDEKLLNTEIRDQFPNLVDRIETAEKSITRAEQVLQEVNDDIQYVTTDIGMVLNGTDTNQITLNDIVQEINELTVALKDEKLLNTEIRDRFPNFVDQVQNGMKMVLNETQMQLKNIVNEMTELKNENQMQLKNIVIEMTELKKELVEVKKASISKTDIVSISKMCFDLYNTRPKSCVEIYERGNRVSGQYDVYPDGGNISIQVYCDQEVDGGGWTVFQRRINGTVDFYREWTDYKNGFGDLDGEFWLGNDYLSNLTFTNYSQLRIDMENFHGEKRYAKYNEFQIQPEDEKYTLMVSGYSGTAGDSLTYHNGRPFSTKDRDNDSSREDCAVKYTGAWWYHHCYISNLNGQYLGRSYDNKGIAWQKWEKFNSLKFTEMKFR